VTEQERIEGINSEQLATATDRVLLASRFGRARPSSPALFARGSSPQLPFHDLYAPQTDAPLYAPALPKRDAPPYAPPARASAPEIHQRASSGRNDEHTVFTRLPKHYKAAWKKIAAISLVTSLISAAAAIVLLV
jgi:hypothetical protein